MENSRKTSSVMAKLMGLDESPPLQRPVSRQQSVLSENYLQKSGSIGKRLRKDSPNTVLGSKKRGNVRTNKDGLSKEFEQKSMRLDGVQGVKSRDVENGKLGEKIVGSGPSLLRDSQTVFAWEMKKQLLERHKMNKVSQRLQPDFVNSIGVKSKEGWKCEAVAKLPIFNGLNFSSNLNTKSVKTTRSNLAINKKKKKLLVSNSSTTVTVGSDRKPETKNVEYFHGDTNDMSDLSSEQDSPIRSDEEHSDGKVERYQHSPNSVLETPFREDNSASSECCESAKTDLHGLWMQLHLLQSESEENDNDSNPEMVTSSDDETSTYTDPNTISTIASGAKESRDFSYLVDVLNESGFQDGNVEIQFKQWHSSECMAGPSVFETLEKKYGKQELWHKSERKLLFDRINSGMAEIVRPRVDIKVCSKPLRMKMRGMFRKDVIEEELLALLVGQEQGVDDGVSEKAVGRGLWFDPVDELDSVVREIEMFLFDELAAEFVAT